jgi:hypothetical protein
MRSSDGSHFNKIGTVMSVASANYEFRDADKQANSFYRIQYVYNDGRSGMSRTLNLSANTLKEFSAFYRSGGLQVRLVVNEKTVVSVNIYNSTGALLSTSRHAVDKGQNNFLVPETQVWKPGTYFVSVTEPGRPSNVVKFMRP